MLQPIAAADMNAADSSAMQPPRTIKGPAAGIVGPAAHMLQRNDAQGRPPTIAAAARTKAAAFPVQA